ncbi:MAG: glutaminase [Muribaculaceae bacterium]|nr:glutaminase [Muribaculaceae bacterium]MDE7141814.1 glutaminase [Muribaculaceae bacterium]
MERKISLSDLRKAVDEAYAAVDAIKEGEINPRNLNAVAGQFGITVTLTDGTTISKGDTKVKVPMGSIIHLPLHSVLFSQLGVDKVVEKSGKCPCCRMAPKPKGLAFGAHGIRAFSAVEPAGDPESKWNLYENRMTDLMGSAPELADNVYKNLLKEAAETKTAETLADSGYQLYDDTALSLDLYLKALAMGASTEQLAMMGATVAADGVNPATRKIVFDGELSQSLVGLMAAKGPHKMNLPWLVKTGIPAKNSFGGTILGIIPGVMAIAAYAPELNQAGVSVKAARAIMEIARRLDLSVFASARIKVVTD